MKNQVITQEPLEIYVFVAESNKTVYITRVGSNSLGYDGYLYAGGDYKTPKFATSKDSNYKWETHTCRLANLREREIYLNCMEKRALNITSDDEQYVSYLISNDFEPDARNLDSQESIHNYNLI
jgi:hypothetical protein